MIKPRIILLIAFLGVFSVAGAQKKMATLEISIDKFFSDNVFLGCLHSPEQSVSLPYHPGDTVVHSFETDDMLALQVNGWISVCLEPGDRVQMHISYAGRNVEKVTFSGSERGVIQNDLLWKIQMSRQTNKFWADLLAAVVLDVSSARYHEMVKEQYAREMELIHSEAARSSAGFQRYTEAETEGLLYFNLIKYPDVYSEVRKKTQEESYVPDYWTFFDHYTFREDPVSLSSRNYCSFLLIYKEYADRKEAMINKVEYTPERDVRKQYKEVAGFYKGPVRDAALYAFVARLLASGQDFEMAEKLAKDYLRKYNKIKSYKLELTQLLK